MLWLKQSTAATLRIGPFLDDTDGKTAETGLTVSQADVRLSKNGGAAAQKNDATACTHDENGYYSCPVNTTDTNTLGRLRVEVIESGALPVWHEYLVVPANVYDSLVSGSDYLQADSVQIEGADATDTINAQCDTALSDYDAPTKAELDSGLAGLNDLSAAEVNAEVDTALADYDAPTKAELDAGLAGLNDLSAAEVNAEVDTALAEYDGVVPADLPANFSDLAIAPTTGYVTAGTVSDKTGYALTSAYDAAKTAAAAGAQMDLVDAPNATAVTAIQSGLAPANEYDVEMARIDDTVSSRAQAGDAMTLNDLGAGKVWDALLTGLITPDSIGKLIVDSLDAAISSRGTADPGDAMDLVNAPNAAAIAALQAGLAPAGEYDTELDAPISTRSSHAAADVAALLNDLSSGDVETAVAAALAAYLVVTQGDLSGAVAGLATSLEIAALNNLSSADAEAAATAALTTYGPLTASQVEAAPPNFSNFALDESGRVDMGAVAGTAVTSPDDLKADVSALSTFDAANDEVNVGAVAGTAITGPDDLKADVSTLSTLTEAQVQALLGTLNDLSTADVSALLAALQLHGDGAWVTATGFSTHSAADVTGGRTVAAVEAALRGTGAESLTTLATAIDEIEAGTAGGDATLAKQDAILAALTALMGEGWEGETDTLVALAQALAALPAGTLAAIEAAHGTGPYDGIGTPTAQIVSSRVVEAGEQITFYRDSTPQTVTILRAGVDFSEWDCYFTIKPTSALDDADNAAAVCTVEGDGYPGVVRFAVTASHVAALERDRAYHFSAERKRGEEYQLDLMGTCKLVWNVRRDV